MAGVMYGGGSVEPWPEPTIHPKDPNEDPYREGFIDGYLRAYADGQEYACSVGSAETAFEEFSAEGVRTKPREDVQGW